VKQTHLLAQAL
jgi:transposase InsO family protein